MTSNLRRCAIDFHAHTNYSADCSLSPRRVIELARDRGLMGIAITDHDNEEGGFAARDANPYSDFLVIPGVEIKTDLGDLIGLFISSRIKSRRFREVAEEIHSQDGFVYVPHPLRTFKQKFPQMVEQFQEADAWELLNGRYSPEEYRDARVSFASCGIQHALAGSDSHMEWDIGVCRSLLSGLPTSAACLRQLLVDAVNINEPITEFQRKSGIYLGSLIRARKRRQYWFLAKECLSFPWKGVRYAAKAVLRRH